MAQGTALMEGTGQGSLGLRCDRVAYRVQAPQGRLPGKWQPEGAERASAGRKQSTTTALPWPPDVVDSRGRAAITSSRRPLPAAGTSRVVGCRAACTLQSASNNCRRDGHSGRSPAGRSHLTGGLRIRRARVAECPGVTLLINCMCSQACRRSSYPLAIPRVRVLVSG